MANGQDEETAHFSLSAKEVLFWFESVFPIITGAHSLKEMVSKLKKPRITILLVKAGQAVDDFIDKLVCSFSACFYTQVIVWL